MKIEVQECVTEHKASQQPLARARRSAPHDRAMKANEAIVSKLVSA